jgi:ferritin-like metal-binding protein YciE
LITLKNTHIEHGIIDDAYDMEKELYIALQALDKMARFCDSPYSTYCNFHEFSIVEIDDMFHKLEKDVEGMTEVNMRRAMQD